MLRRALVHAALGDPGQARRLAGEQLTLARAFGRPRTLGVSLRACGLIEGSERGLELVREAVQTLERSQSPLELARALSDHGARRIAAGARAELIAAGAKPRRDAITGLLRDGGEDPGAAAAIS